MFKKSIIVEEEIFEFNPQNINEKPAQLSRDKDTDNYRRARYRIEQQNIVKVNGLIVSSIITKRQYAFGIARQQPGGYYQGYIRLEEAYLDHSNESLKSFSEFMELFEYVKSDVKFVVDGLSGQLLQVLNMEELYKNWSRFKEGATSNQFIKDISKEKSTAAEEIFKAGDKEFTNQKLFIANFATNYFYQTILDQYLVRPHTDITYNKTKVYSHFFTQPLELQFLHKIIDENEAEVTMQKNGRIGYADIHAMIKEYDKVYKPNIKYNFTDYSYTTDTTIVVSKEDKLINEANILVQEMVKENIEAVVICKIKRIVL